MRVVIRADASRTIGFGHVMRCLTLAESLRAGGASVEFVSRLHPGHLCELIESRNFPVHRLPPGDSDPSSDARQTLEVIGKGSGKPDWLVVDHYELDARWESALRPSVSRVFVIDDMADRQHDCDLLLDQNLVAEMHTRYTLRTPQGCAMLLGPEYALLQPIYSELHKRTPLRKGSIRRILIYFGGADNVNLTNRAIAAVQALHRPDIEADVVTASDRFPSLAPRIAAADLGIGAAGTTSWERLCLGLPSIVVSVAECQRRVAEGLHSHGLARWLGHYDKVFEQDIHRELAELVEHGIDEEWSARCHKTVDGKGVGRVTAALLTGSSPLRVRHAELSDEALILAWANDPETRRNAFLTECIPYETHRRWFRGRLLNPEGCRFFIVETSACQPLGQVRFDRTDDAWEISYSLAPGFRGRGLGRPFLESALLKLRAEFPGAFVIGKVKESNRPSLKVFESLDFNAQPGADGVVVFRRVL